MMKRTLTHKVIYGTLLALIAFYDTAFAQTGLGYPAGGSFMILLMVVLTLTGFVIRNFRLRVGARARIPRNVGAVARRN